MVQGRGPLQRVAAVMLCLAFVLAAAGPAAAGQGHGGWKKPKPHKIKLFVGDRELHDEDEEEEDEDQVVILGDTAMVPLRLVGEGLGSKVEWDGAGARALVYRDGDVIAFPAGSGIGWMNGRKVGLSRGARLINGRMYVPLRMLIELLGGTVTWDGERGAIVIELPILRNPPPPTVVRPPSGEALGYSLAVDASDSRTLVFTVTNRSGSPVELFFPSGKSFDVVLKKDGVKVWRASDGESYTQASRTQELPAGAKLTYRARMPELQAGTYLAEAYFEGIEGRGRPVATTWVNVAASVSDPLKRLQYGLTFGYAGSPSPAFRAVFTAKNPGSTAVVLSYPTSRTFDLAVRRGDREVWRYSSEGVFAQVITEVRIDPGANRTYYVDMPSLAPGWYTVQAFFGPNDTPVASQGFYQR